MTSTHNIWPGPLVSEQVWGIMSLISQYSGGGGFAGPQGRTDYRRPNVRSCADPGGMRISGPVRADSTAEASDVPATMGGVPLLQARVWLRRGRHDIKANLENCGPDARAATDGRRGDRASGRGIGGYHR